MHRSLSRLIVFALAVLPLAPRLLAQPAPPDLVVFTNGERLTGQLQTADSSGITFNSAMAGVVKASWANVAELHSSKHFAVLDSRIKLNRRDAEKLVPRGTVSVDAKDKAVVVATAEGPRTIPIADASNFIDPSAFDKTVVHPPRFYQGFGGTATLGASLVRATQDSTTYNGALNLIQTSPGVAWLPPRNRTSVNFMQSYGTVSQANTPTVETNILHADTERDEYFSQRMYVFVSGAFDHNYASSLELQQAYGGGIGITVIKTPRQELDFKGNVQYEKQSFFTTAANPTLEPSQNIIGSLFSDTYVRHLTKTILLNEFSSISPAWNVSKDYSAHANMNLIFPIYHGLAFNVGAVDDYLNNAPVGSKRNSVQFTTGVTYKIK
jgi:hypothetical protein